MILTCPECATSYFVDDSRIADTGRSVKCTSCGARWTAFREVEPAAVEPDGPTLAEAQPDPPRAADHLDIVAIAPADDPEPVVVAPIVKPRAAGREAAGKVWIWVGAAAAVAVLIIAAVVFRREVVNLVPATQGAYAGLGLPVAALVIEQVKAQPTFEGGRPVLAVSGAIRNSRAATANAPAIRIELLDAAGKLMAAKVASPIDAVVPGHGTRYFTIVIVDPPAGVHDMAVSFEAASTAHPAHPATPSRAAQAVLPHAEEATPLAPGTPDALPAAAHHE